MHGDVAQVRGVDAPLGADVHRLVDRIGEQALFARVDRVGETFARKLAVVEDGEAAAVQRRIAGVGEPQRPQRHGIRCVVQSDALSLDVGLENGDEGGLVLVDGDRLGEGVLEEVVEFGRVGARGFVLDGVVVRTSAVASAGAGTDAAADAGRRSCELLDAVKLPLLFLLGRSHRSAVDRDGLGRRRDRRRRWRRSLERPLMRDGRNVRRFRHGHFRPLRIDRLRKRLDEALRRSCDQRELDVVPVRADSVVDDRPSLQNRGF